MTVELPPGDPTIRSFFDSLAYVYTDAEWRSVLAATVRPGPSTVSVRSNEEGAETSGADESVPDARPKVGSNDLRLELFYWHWTLKEAYLKVRAMTTTANSICSTNSRGGAQARGVGLGFELKRVEFRWDELEHGWQPSVFVDGAPPRGWHFSLCRLDETHVLSVAHAPVCCSRTPQPRLRLTLIPSVAGTLLRQVAEAIPTLRDALAKVTPEDGAVTREWEGKVGEAVCDCANELHVSPTVFSLNELVGAIQSPGE